MKKTVKLLVPLAMTILFISSLTSCKEKAEEATETETVAESAFNLTTAKAEIEAANKEFMALFAATDSVGVANLYTHDAKFMMNGAPAFSGKESIQSILSGIMNSGISSVDLRTIEVWGTEDVLIEEGELTLFAGDAEADQGKFLVAWKNVEGKWKLHRDIFNSNLPAVQ